MSLFVTIGCPGAGKSTWAEANLTPKTLRLERDRFRECIFGSRRAYHESPMPHNDRQAVIDQAMLGAMDAWPYTEWAVTDTGLELPRVDAFIQHAKHRFEDTTLVIFDRPWPLLAERNASRDEAHRIPADILANRFELFTDPSAWWRTMDFAKVYA